MTELEVVVASEDTGLFLLLSGTLAAAADDVLLWDALEPEDKVLDADDDGLLGVDD